MAQNEEGNFSCPRHRSSFPLPATGILPSCPQDYLADGAMADSADLVVLGAEYGTGKMGGKVCPFTLDFLTVAR